MKKIINTYRRYEHLSDYHAPKFTSNASEFHVTLWNLNYDGSDNITTRDRASQEMEFIKEPKEFTKEFIKEPIGFTKEFIKASRQIYKLISMNPKVSTENNTKLKEAENRISIKLHQLGAEIDSIGSISYILYNGDKPPH